EQHGFRLIAGRVVNAGGQLLSVAQDCGVALATEWICGPETVLVDQAGSWHLSPAPVRNLIMSGGGCNTIYFIHPFSGGVLGMLHDATFNYIGQMAINSAGRLFVGSINGSCLWTTDGNTTTCFYGAPGLRPRAVAVDQADTVYLTCSV